MASARSKSVARIAVVGVGQVGGAAAYALVLASVASELLLVDVDVDLRDAQVCDLADVAYSSNSSTRVRAATYAEAGQCDIVVVTAGSRYKLGETKLHSVYRNVSIVRRAVDAMTPFKSDAILLVVSNPVDLLTSLAQKLSGLPTSQVLGSGTFLDSVRLRGLVADKAGVAANSIDIYVLGVRGDAQVAAWSMATIGGVAIDTSLPPNSRIDRQELEDECKNRSESIAKAKGSTPFGIGAIVSSICVSISSDKLNIRPLSCFQPDFGCYFSMPVVVGRKGFLGMIPTPLNSKEDSEIAESAKRLRNDLDRIYQDWDTHS